jgi:hypothetical protein
MGLKRPPGGVKKIADFVLVVIWNLDSLVELNV